MDLTIKEFVRLVRPDQYNDSKAALAHVKEQVIEDFSSSCSRGLSCDSLWRIVLAADDDLSSTLSIFTIPISALEANGYNQCTGVHNVLCLLAMINSDPCLVQPHG